MEVVRFETEEGKKIWTSNGVVSGCLKVTNEVFNPETGFVNKETFMNWIKANDEETVEKHLLLVAKNIETGTLVPYRVFSETPFYEEQPMDINPQTEESMNRYSDTRLGAVAKAIELHRRFITVTPTAVVNTGTPVTTEE